MVTTPPVPPGRPEDHDDPTGVRALLAGLGDPGPMPADLVDRINASIAAEQHARSAREDRTVVPLRRRLPSWPKLGLAAAAVAAVAVGVPAMLGTGPGDVMASLGGSSSSDSAASGPRAESGAQAPDVGNRAASSTGEVRLATSGTAYTSSALTTQARSVIDRGAALGATDTRKDAADPTEATLRDCLTALGVAGWMSVTGDVGTYDGRPAVVAVVSSDTGQSVYAVPPDCDATHAAVMVGPVPLG